MQAKKMSFAAAVASSAGNLLNPPTLTGGVGTTSTACYIVITRLRVTNKTAAPVDMSAFIGATAGSAAGTEFLWTATPIAAYDNKEWFGDRRLDSSQFLTGLASAATSLVIEGDYEIGIA